MNIELSREYRMKKIVSDFQEYVATYSNQMLYETFSDEMFIEDMIYCLGTAIDGKYKFADGYKEWKKVLMSQFVKKEGHGLQKSVEALNKFKEQYPNCTSADLQTFVIGYNRALEDIVSEQTKISPVIQPSVKCPHKNQIWVDNSAGRSLKCVDCDSILFS